MASNPTPDNADVLRALADRMADGCHTHEAAIGILQNTEAAIRAAITALSAAETTAGFKKTELSAAYDALQAADAAGTQTIVNCKLRLQAVLGQRWSTAWEPTGFPNQSVAMPDKAEQRFTLLDALKNYFTAVPANENAGMGATAAACTAAWTAWSDARQTVANCDMAQTAAFDARAAATDALRKRVRGLIDELGTIIADDDSRYRDFGLNINYFTLNANNPGTPAQLGPWGEGKVGVIWNWVHNAPTPELEKIYVDYKKKYNEDFIFAAHWNTMNMLREAMRKAQSTDAKKVAFAMEGMTYKSPIGEVKMRKNDHQLEAPLYLGIWAKKGSKGVKYDAENTGYGFRTEVTWDSYISAQPTSCQMKRPS